MFSCCSKKPLKQKATHDIHHNTRAGSVFVAVSFVYNQFINKTFMTSSQNSSTSLNTVSGQGLHIERKIFLTKSLLNLSYLFDIFALFCCFPFFVFCFILDLRASGYFLFILVYKIINSS